MDFIFGLAPDGQDRTGILVFVDRFSKMTHLVPVHATITAAETAVHFSDTVFRHHGLPDNIGSDRDPRFTSAFWTSLFELLGTKLQMSTAAHPETDGQTERVNRVLEDVLRSYATSFTSWSAFLPLAEFALNNAVYASTGLTPFFANSARHPRVPTLLAVGQPTALRGSTLAGGENDKQRSSEDHGILSANVVNHSKAKSSVSTPHDVASPLAQWTAQTLIDPSSSMRNPKANYAPIESARPIDDMAVSEFILQRQAITRFVRDTLRSAVYKQKANADKRGRKNTSTFKKGDRVLLTTEGLRDSAVTNLGASKLAPRFIGPFTVLKAIGVEYTLAIPSSLLLHPTMYVGRLKEYRPATLHGLAPSSESKPSLSPCSTRQRHRTRLRPSLRVPMNLAFQVPHPSKQLALGQGQLQPPAGHQQPCSKPHLHRPGQPGRQQYHREGPPPLVDAEGQKRWIVERLLGHEDPRRDTMSARFQPRASIVYVGSGFHPSRIHLVDDLCVLAVSENEMHDDGVVVKCHHDYESESDCENVVVTFHHDDEMKSDDENVATSVYRDDHANENVVASAWHHDLENASGVASVTRHD
uniref:Integrase catalytic domain-containing protein n=1 Tax=Peronospora matthiolae TaxID=2874970 RepID=A0AAV1U2E9_9STRA